MHENVDHLVTLHEIVEEARRRLSDGVWDYLAGGAESETTLRRNRQALDSIAFRPRVLRDVSGSTAPRPCSGAGSAPRCCSPPSARCRTCTRAAGRRLPKPRQRRGSR